MQKQADRGIDMGSGMRKILWNFCILMVVFALGTPLPAAAEKPAWAGNANGGKKGHSEAKGNSGKGGRHGAGRANKHAGKNWNADNRYFGAENHPSHNFNFDDHQRAIIHDYYAPRFRSGRCPPGLAKKYNGCMPPGQAKKWAIGYPLPSNVIFYDLPSPLLAQLGYPGPGYRYVRVAADVLLIAAGTGMVLAAMEDLNSM